VKRLHKLIIRTYLGPFIITFFITLFILVMQFLWKYIDEMVGKGLEWYIIAELLFYASANLVPMALPLAILLSSIMTFGNLGENYELVALKSAGMSLQRIMSPLIVVILLTSVLALYFSNNIWPTANLKFASLLYDIRQKKPAIDIKSGVFYKGIDGYVIRAGKKDKDGQTLHDIIIYDHTDRKGNTKVIKAESCQMQMSEDELYLVMTLKNGHSYDEVKSEDSKDNNPLFRSKFKEDKLRFKLEGFKMERSDEELFKDNYQMLNLRQLNDAVDTLNLRIKERKDRFKNQMLLKLACFRDSSAIPSQLPDSIRARSFLDHFTEADQIKILETAVNLTRSNKTYISAMANEFEQRKRSMWKHKIEWHRKWTLSVACIVLFFIGAPLGAIIRKGGLGMPVVVSVLFFLVFHVLSITGEKLVKQGELLPYKGMWLATAVLFPIGVFLSYKATTDSAIMQSEAYYRFFESVSRFIRAVLFIKKER